MKRSLVTYGRMLRGLKIYLTGVAKCVCEGVKDKFCPLKNNAENFSKQMNSIISEKTRSQMKPIQDKDNKYYTYHNPFMKNQQ